MTMDNLSHLGRPLTQAESEALARRRRGRNWALFLALLAFCALFYAISMVKLAALK